VSEANAQPAVILVDHGSRREEANAMLLDVVAMFERETNYAIVEAAHMELAEPSIATAFARCVERGAKSIVVFPYFLLPGKHWRNDIPALAAKAAGNHPEIEYFTAAPLGVHHLMAQIITDRIDHCRKHIAGNVSACETCAGDTVCMHQ